jgi:HPr kinase/phosphorylase
MHRLIKEGSINRPALALTGFFKYFAQQTRAGARCR